MACLLQHCEKFRVRLFANTFSQTDPRLKTLPKWHEISYKTFLTARLDNTVCRAPAVGAIDPGSGHTQDFNRKTSDLVTWCSTLSFTKQRLACLYQCYGSSGVLTSLPYDICVKKHLMKEGWKSVLKHGLTWQVQTLQNSLRRHMNEALVSTTFIPLNQLLTLTQWFLVIIAVALIMSSNCFNLRMPFHVNCRLSAAVSCKWHTQKITAAK